MVWKIDNEQCNESKKICYTAAPYLRGKGLDLGAGDFKVLPHVISVDNMNHEKFGFQIKPDIMCDCTNLSMFTSQSMDFIYSSHLLEHIEDYKAALNEWWRLVKQDGYLILYLPHKDFYPNIGEKGSNPDHKHDFLPKDIIDAMETVNGGKFDLIEMQERNEDEEYSMFLVFQKIKGSKNKYSASEAKPDKTCCVVRYGAFGDLLQASSVFAGLKKQGYHVTLFTSPPGSDVITHDPNIDKIVLFDKDQVPNADLTNFWNVQKKYFDKFINLSESVEGTWLAMPGRTQHGWSPLIRHKYMNENYLEFQHMMAGVPHKPEVKFFATLEEKAWAKKIRARMSDFVIVFSLAGSAVHKTWPYLDNILASLMVGFDGKNGAPKAEVVLVGGPESVILEAGWENEPRVHKTSGKWSIRETMAFLPEADLIIGPETGTLNAAANLPVPKIVFLSHSSENNLTRDWVNTTSLISKNTKCKGRGENEAPTCHMLHYGWDHCTKDEMTGTAQCQADISGEEVWNCIQEIINQRFANAKKKA
jgi:ADP-heptose:LPS heptosyltransferase/predicted SAM-dependent methyltransferase